MNDEGNDVTRAIPILLLAGLLLTACQETPGEPAPTDQTPTPEGFDPDADPSPTAEPTLPAPGTEPATPEAEETLTGTLGGDPNLEGGCTWLDAPEGRYEVLYPDQYEVRADPPTLIGPDGEVVAEDGDELVLVGHAEPDMLSLCQVGPIWRAIEVEQA